MTPEQRHQLRQQLAPPILAAIKEQLEEHPRLLSNSPMSKAMRYAPNEWEALVSYLKDGRVETDNSLTENAIRPSALGKKNWLFIGHPEAGWRSAAVYSIIVSCKRRGIRPWEYLKDVLEKLPSATIQQIAAFTPAAWQPNTGNLNPPPHLSMSSAPMRVGGRLHCSICYDTKNS